MVGVKMRPKIIYRKRRGSPDRNRGLAKYDKKFGLSAIENFIRRSLRSRKSVSVLEIGCGEGRTLMELRRIFGDIELHGINKERYSAVAYFGPKRTLSSTKLASAASPLKGVRFHSETGVRFHRNTQPSGNWPIWQQQVSVTASSSRPR